MSFCTLRTGNALVLLVLLCKVLMFVNVAHSQSSAEHLPVSTADRLSGTAWWPTRSGALSETYAGGQACAECHRDETRMQPASAMARAASRVTPDAIWKLTTNSAFVGAYSYKMFVREAALELQVSKKGQTDTAAVAWLIGADVHGQTYLLDKAGQIYESQLSHFASLQQLDLTPGHQPAADLQGAMGAKLSTGEVQQCAACHMTASSTENGLDLAHATPGIQCEACHGPGKAHIRAVRSGNVDEALHSITRPSTFRPAESIDFCGACHRTSMDVLIEQTELGVGTVRFQPYRLQKSRCWQGGEDARLTCAACHDPHQPLIKQASSYDRNCLSCHAKMTLAVNGHQRGSPLSCPKATANCTSCHMPKYQVPDMHAQFTDHDIRIVHTGDAYPR